MVHTAKRACRYTAAALLLSLASACSDGSGFGPRIERAEGLPPEVARHADDWPLPGRDYLNSRATFDSSIDASNVATLEVAWEVATGAELWSRNLTTTPSDGVDIQPVAWGDLVFASTVPVKVPEAP